MSARVLLGALLPALLVAPFTTASAGIPTPWNSHVDPVLVGNAGGGSVLSFTVVPRDASDEPEFERFVTLKFLNPALTLLEQQDPGVVVDCAARTVGRYPTEPDAVAVFHVRFGGIGQPGDVEVRAGGVLIGTVPARSTDIDASGATNLADLSLFADALFGAGSSTDFDFDLSGKVDLGDLDILRRDLFYGVPGKKCP